MSIKQKLEQAQASSLSKVVFEITADELIEFVKQVSNVSTVKQSVPVISPKVENSPVSPKANQGLSKSTKGLQDQIAELQSRIDSLENILYDAKQVLTCEEAAIFMGLTRSSLYKMTHEHEIPFYRPNGKRVYFEKSELLNWIRSVRNSSQKEIEEEAKRKIQELAMKTYKKKK